MSETSQKDPATENAAAPTKDGENKTETTAESETTAATTADAKTDTGTMNGDGGVEKDDDKKETHESNDNTTTANTANTTNATNATEEAAELNGDDTKKDEPESEPTAEDKTKPQAADDEAVAPEATEATEAPETAKGDVKENGETKVENGDDAKDGEDTKMEDGDKHNEVDESKKAEGDVDMEDATTEPEQSKESKETPATETPAAPESEPPVESTPPKRKRGRPPKRKTPQTGSGTSSTTTTPSKTPTTATRSSKRRTPQSAKSTESPTTPTTGEDSSSKRQRRAATTYEPTNFKAERLAAQASQQCPPGRGVPLSSLEVVKNNIGKKNNDAVLHNLYRFVLGTMGLTGRGKPASGKIKSALLEFSGFLSPEGENMDVDGEEDNETKDEEMKEKFLMKAEELKMSTLKAYCDVFQLRRGVMKKMELVEKLVEFLAAPSESMLTGGVLMEATEAIAASKEVKKKRGPGRPPKNSSTSAASSGEVKKKRGPGRPRKKKPEEEEEEENLDFEEGKEEEVQEEEVQEDDDDQDEVIDGKTIPSAKKLRKWVEAYVTVFNLDTCTAKHAIATASEKFDVDMECKKDVIINMLKEAV